MTDQPQERGARPGLSRPALSPSRAADFKQCPLLYRFRAIDRLPEPPSTAQLRGSVVHAALEQLYGLPAADAARTRPDRWWSPAWEQVIAAEPDLAGELDPELRRPNCSRRPARCSPATTGWKTRPGSTRRAASSGSRSNSPTARCCAGFIDRIDVAATGELRVVDYKTGKAPPAAGRIAEFKAMFQMKFYAVALLRSRGVLPTRLRLIYLADGQVLDYSPDQDELLRFEKTLMAIWRAIQSAGATGDFRPQAVAAVRLVPAPGALPGFRWHTAALSRVAGASAGTSYFAPDRAGRLIARLL